MGDVPEVPEVPEVPDPLGVKAGVLGPALFALLLDGRTKFSPALDWGASFWLLLRAALPWPSRCGAAFSPGVGDEVPLPELSLHGDALLPAARRKPR